MCWFADRAKGAHVVVAATAAADHVRAHGAPGWWLSDSMKRDFGLVEVAAVAATVSTLVCCPTTSGFRWRTSSLRILSSLGASGPAGLSGAPLNACVMPSSH
uniref:Putative secreted protein n=1 Tax=Anopheles triannulatus TaxID=58253 RepID=A0A2M4B5H2_9DIPT